MIKEYKLLLESCSSIKIIARCGGVGDADNLKTTREKEKGERVKTVESEYRCHPKFFSPEKFNAPILFHILL